MKTMNKWLLAGLIGLSVAGAQATPVVVPQTETFTDTPSTIFWRDLYGNGSEDNNAGYITMTVANDVTYNFGAFLYDTVNSPFGSMDWSSVYKITFDVETSATFTPLVAYFIGDETGSDNIWLKEATAVSGAVPGFQRWQVTGWNVPSEWVSPMNLPNGRSFNGGEGQTWPVNYQSMAGVGFYMFGNETGEGATYKGDNFAIYGNEIPTGVPEPETVWMIVAVLASLAVTFRRQLIGMVVKA